MKRKTLSVAMGLLLLMMTLAGVGCTATSPGPAPAPAAAPAPAPAAKVINLTLATLGETTAPASAPAKRAAESIEAMTGGRVKVKVYFAGEVVPGGQETQALNKGVVDMAMTVPAYSKDVAPQAPILSNVSGGLTAAQFMFWYRVGDGMTMARKVYQGKGMIPLAHLQLCGEDWCYSNVKLNAVADLKGLKFRASGDAGEILAKMGVSTIFMIGGDIYESMQRKIIDAFEYTTAADLWSLGFYEVIKYLYISPTRAPSDGLVTWVSEKRWSEIPPDLQRIITEALWIEQPRYYGDTMVAAAQAMQKIQARGGIEILQLPKAIDDEYVKVAAQFYDEKAAKDPLYAEIIKSQRAFKTIMELQGIR